jgi:hypothetical protein
VGGVTLPFKGNRILIFAFLAIFIVVIIIVASASSTPSKPHIKGLEVCTVQAEIGVASIKISNQNTGNSIIKTGADLPYSFNFTVGDTLKFQVTTLAEYTFNAWVFNTGTFDNHNPLNLKPTDSVTMTANILVKGEMP